jgi:four helix bundle protein
VEQPGDKKVESFEDLDCWKAATEVRRFTAQLLANYPKEERYALTIQMKRAARSGTHNIAEGYGRFHYQENIQFCRQSRGSLYELLDQYITSRDENYITDEQYQEGRKLLVTAIRILNGYIKYLNRKVGNDNPKDN